MASTSSRLNELSEALKAKLLERAEKGDLRAFKAAAHNLALHKGESSDETIFSARDKNGNGPLHYAAASGNYQICRYMIDELKFDPNLSSYTGKTPIMHAAGTSHVRTIKYLIENGANLHERAADGFNAVHNATFEAKHKALKALVLKGGPVDAEYLTGAPLLLAAYYADASSMKILLECNANPNILCEFISPLVLSVTKDSKQCVEVLKTVVDLSKIPLLEWAFDSKEMLLYLLNNGADPNLPNELGQLPLEIAAAKGKKEIVDILFPLTSARPEWIEGLFPYVESENYKKEWQALSKRRIESLKNEIKNALHRREYFGASILSEFATNEDPSDSIAETIHTLCWMRFSRAMVATSITMNLPDHCPCSNNAGLFSLTDSECEEALFALIEGQLSAPILEKITTSKMEKLTLSR